VLNEKYFLHGSDWLSIREARKRIESKNIPSRGLGKNIKKILFITKTVLKVSNETNFLNKTLFSKVKYILIFFE
jgi:hypothetical protein